ncbi:translation initiation factor IF-2 [Filifactor alocis ATCC 35896]|mgnify:CR=1 FL=1|uniref:Translation initiation factor IF-2 n=1 Tax=Filifactor alocis (strain ATCC 35896 / CCUG 47790 / D40 B5) TaxID=546269 RepID=D6GRX2_FILAD|nr:translation initiation factor IF-2 [Filifactor alocis]EFE28413.1 translation initiation factor IF-2 [Filifactor alocis ATCC 35896]
MEKIRVYKLAQELNISSKKVIETAVKLSINVASHMSTLTADDSNKIRVTLSNASSKKETNKTVNQSKKKQLNQNYSEKDSDKILKKQDNKEKLKPSIISQPEAVDKNKGEDSLKNKKMKKKVKKNEKIKVKSAPIQEKQSGYHNDKMMKKSKGKKHDYVNKKEKESKQDMSEVVKQDEGIFEIDDTIVVGDLAQILNVPATDVIMSIMKLGIMANINQTIKFETAEKVALDYDVMLVQKEKEEEVVDFVIEEDREEDLKPRSPIVTVMGHVDHGKTTLLDTIRNTKVTNSEAGGITQHIGASEVVINGKKIVFLDTPGHEAFTEMRARGAQVTDIVIIVVAADDGIMPQTIEAIDHVKAAGVPMIIAINKIDKPTANIDRVRQELSEKGILVESWGGTTIDVPVSAKTGEHIDDLLEMVLLVAEMEELRANPNRKAIGTVVESKLDKGRGTVATLIVQNGTLKEGDPVVAGTAYGRVRAMLNSKGKRIKKAGPSTAVEIQGLNSVPDAGDQFFAVSSDKEARDLGTARQERKREEYMKQTSKISLEDLFEKMQSGEMKELNIIVKADVQGSIDAIKKSFEKISNEEVVVKVIHGSVGAITESDVMLASASNAIIIGFNVRPATGAVSIAEREKVDMRTYRIIYEAIEDVEKAMKGMLSPEFVEEELGKAEVRMPFKVPKVGMIAGSYVLEGKIQRNAKVRLVRDGIVIYEGEIDSLRRFKDDVKEVAAGYDCGIGLTNYNDIKEGDIIENYIIKEIKKG